MTQLLDIEKELTGPDGSAALERYDQTLVALEERFSTAMRQGLPPEEYNSANQLKEAILIARKLLRLALREGGQGG